MDSDDYFVKIASPFENIDKIENLSDLKHFIIDFGISELSITINEDRILLHPKYDIIKVTKWLNEE